MREPHGSSRIGLGVLLRTPAVAILTVWAFAVAQPFYSVLGEHPALLVAHRTTGVEILLLVVTVSLILPAGLVGLWASTRRLAGERPAQGIATGVIGLLTATGCAAPLTDRLELGTPVAIAAALALGVAAGVAYHRWRGARDLLAFASPAVVVFPAFLLFATPVFDLLRPDRAASVHGVAVPPTPVVMVVFDMLPVSALLAKDGDIDRQLFPAFARLADSSVWLRHGTTIEPATHRAIPALLTGQRARRQVIATYQSYPDNLFSLLGRPGRTHVFESVTQLCPPTLCGLRDGARPSRMTFAVDLAVVMGHVVLPAGWRGSLPPLDEAWVDFAHREAAEDAPPLLPTTEVPERQRRAQRADVREDQEGRLEAFLADLPRGDGGSLSYLHLNLPHSPFVFLADGRRYVPRSELRGLRLFEPEGYTRHQGVKRWVEDPELVRLAYQRLLLQVAFADRVLARIVVALEEAGLYDRALLVVTSDHGQTYRPGRELRDMKDAETRHVPLFIKLSGQSARRVLDEPATLLDVVPTIAERLGVEVGWEVAGTPRISEEMAGSVRVAAAPAPAPDLPNRSPLRRLLRRKARWVGGLADPFVSSWLPALHGRAVDELAIGSPRAGVSAKLDMARHLATWRDVVPAYLTGTLEGLPAASPPLELAIAIDGTLRATCRTFQDEQGHHNFAALLPAAAVDSPPHAWSLYEVEKARGGPALRPLAASDAD